MTEKNKDNNLVWGGALILILVLLFFWFNGNGDYKECVNSCAYDGESCISDSTQYSNSGTGYIIDSDAEECINDIESCISRCD